MPCSMPPELAEKVTQKIDEERLHLNTCMHKHLKLRFDCSKECLLVTFQSMQVVELFIFYMHVSQSRFHKWSFLTCHFIYSKPLILFICMLYV
jgi:hypothetical protein